MIKVVDLAENDRFVVLFDLKNDRMVIILAEIEVIAR